MTDLRTAVLTAVSAGSVNSREFAAKNQVDHDALVGVLKSIEALEAIKSEISETLVLGLSDEGKKYCADGSPEYQVWKLVSGAPVPQPYVDNRLGDVAKVGFGAAMKNKWISLDKATKLVSATAADVKDSVQAVLVQVSADGAKAFAEIPKKEVDELKKRKLIVQSKISTFTVTKGAKFTMDLKKQKAELTAEMIQSGSWKSEDFKPYNLKAL